ncbi:MAG: hypothetical protein LBF26_02605 [Puniceicoccales bacterium]|jgi:hypothetical protein|nr:hypothetical protein [Puniceicoccales bacterium]
MSAWVKFPEPVTDAPHSEAGSESNIPVDVPTAPPTATAQTQGSSKLGFRENISRVLTHLPTNIHYLCLVIGYQLKLVSLCALNAFIMRNYELLAFVTAKTPKLPEAPPIAPKPKAPVTPANSVIKQSAETYVPPAQPEEEKPAEDQNFSAAVRAIMEQLRNERAIHESGGVSAISLLRSPEMLNQLKQDGTLYDDRAMAELIITAFGLPDEIPRSDEDNLKNFIQELDKTVLAIANFRNAIVDPSKDSNTRVVNMPRNVFVQFMAPAEEWYFGDRKKAFPEKLARVQGVVEMWFEKCAEQNFNDTEKKLAPDYIQHFRAVAQTQNVLQKIQDGAHCSCAYGMEGPYLMLVERQSRGTREEFTNLSLAVYKCLQANADKGEEIAKIYVSSERQKLPGANGDSLQMATLSRLDTFWARFPTEYFWSDLFTPRAGESPEQTAERVVEFFNGRPWPSCHSSNLLEYLVFAPSAEQETAMSEYEFTNDAYDEASKRFWGYLLSVLGNPAISCDKQTTLWKQLLAPLNNGQAWIDAGPRTSRNEATVATIGKADHVRICDLMRLHGLKPDFQFNAAYVGARASDLAFCSIDFAKKVNDKTLDYLTLYTRMQPDISLPT